MVQKVTLFTVSPEFHCQLFFSPPESFPNKAKLRLQSISKLSDTKYLHVGENKNVFVYWMLSMQSVKNNEYVFF